MHSLISSKPMNIIGKRNANNNNTNVCIRQQHRVRGAKCLKFWCDMCYKHIVRLLYAMEITTNKTLQIPHPSNVCPNFRKAHRRAVIIPRFFRCFSCIISFDVELMTHHHRKDLTLFLFCVLQGACCVNNHKTNQLHRRWNFFMQPK